MLRLKKHLLEMSLFKVLIVGRDPYRIRGASATYANEHLIRYTTHTYIPCAAYLAQQALTVLYWQVRMSY